MKSRNLFILELYTEEKTVANLVQSLRHSAWNTTLVCSPFFATLLPELDHYENVDIILLDNPTDIYQVDWKCADIVLLPNGRFLPTDYAGAFLRSVGDVPFGVGIFGTSVVTARNSPVRRHNFGLKSLWSEASFVYVSDVDFRGSSSSICRYADAAGKSVLVIPFKYPVKANRSIFDGERCVIISGKVQWKRRHYMTSLIVLLVSQKRMGGRLKVILNGRASGIYGRAVSLFAKIITKLSDGFEVVTYANRLPDDAYTENIRQAQINLMPLSAIYNDGKDCGAFYDGIEFNMINVCPCLHLASLGSEHGCLAVGYKSIFELPTRITSAFLNLQPLLDSSLQLTEQYLDQDFRGYLIDQLNILSKNY